MNLKAIFYDWGGLNTWLFHAVNHLQGEVWAQLMLLGTALADTDNFPYYLAGFAVIALTGLWRTPKAKWPYGLLALPVIFFFGFFLDKLLINALKSWFNYPRPMLVFPKGTIHLLGEPYWYHSFPSGHTAFAAVVAASLWPILGFKGRIATALFVVWVGLSRIALGAHFPADVLGGAVVGILACAGLWFLFTSLTKSKSRL